MFCLKSPLEFISHQTIVLAFLSSDIYINLLVMLQVTKIRIEILKPCCFMKNKYIFIYPQVQKWLSLVPIYKRDKHLKGYAYMLVC